MTGPPHPAEAGANCSEADHEGQHRLLPAKDREGNACQVLLNVKTGEKVFLEGRRHQRLFHNHRALLHEKNAEGVVQNAKWILSLMRSSVWTTAEGQEFSYEKHADGWRTRWLSELAVQKAMTTVPLQVGDPGGGIVQLSTWEFRCVAANRSGRHFIEVAPILSAVQWSHTREELSKRWQKKWKQMFLRKHLEDSHFLVPYRSRAAAASSQGGRCSDDMAFSLPASLMLLVHLANEKEQGEALLKSFLTAFLEPCQVTLQAAGETVMLSFLADARMDLEPLRGKAWRSDREWRLPTNLLSADADVVSLLRCLDCTTSSRLCLAFLTSLADGIAEQWLEHVPQEGMGSGHGRVVAARLRQQTADCEAAAEALKRPRSTDEVQASGSAAKSTRRDSNSETSRQLQNDRYRYFLASRRAFHDSKQMCIVDDDTNIGSRNRTQSLLMNLSTGECAWGPPLATRVTQAARSMFLLFLLSLRKILDPET